MLQHPSPLSDSSMVETDSGRVDVMSDLLSPAAGCQNMRHTPSDSSKQAAPSEASIKPSGSSGSAGSDLISLHPMTEVVPEMPAATRSSDARHAGRWYGFEAPEELDNIPGCIGSSVNSTDSMLVRKLPFEAPYLQQQARFNNGHVLSIDDLLLLGGSGSESLDSMAKDLIQF